MNQDEIIAVLLAAYQDTGKRSMDYTYGWMDAVAAIRDLPDSAFRQTFPPEP